MKYHGDEHNVSVQSEAQKYSLKAYLEEHLSVRAPFINNLIWLPRLPTSSLPSVTSNLLARDSVWQDFIDKIVTLSGVREGEVQNIRNSKLFFDIAKILTHRLEPGNLDRRKMELVSKRVARADTQYLSLLREQLLIFRGRGGTGKTLRLLQLGYQLYQEEGARVLLLTYNNALAADISRLLSLLRIQDGIGERAIRVRTVHKFVRDWLDSLELLDPEEQDFLDGYEELKDELMELLMAGALDTSDVDRQLRNNSGKLSWDTILIDECQDWPANERDIIFSLYDHKHCVLADGVDQLVRTDTAIDWREKIDRADSQVVSLRKSLRLKSGLCDFISGVASALDVPDWDLEPEPDIYGGKILIIAGSQYNEQLHQEVSRNVIADGNKVIDMLYCVPPSYVKRDSAGSRYSETARVLAGWGCDVWDGASYSVRSSYPTSTDQYRVVQYDSCRGLEGWATICFGIDEFFDYKTSQFKGDETDLFTSPDSLKRAYASRWVMIPLTRAIDTLVLHVEDVNHPFAKLLRDVATDYAEIVEWRA